jgi:hypothetical protein
MRFLKYFNKNIRSKIIEKIIDDEIIISKKFGLDIEKEHIKIEKDLFKIIFLEYWDKISNDFTFYATYRKTIGDIIHNKLSDITKYYYDKSINNDVRNKYNCHITSVIDNIMRYISNSKK